MRLSSEVKDVIIKRKSLDMSDILENRKIEYSENGKTFSSHFLEIFTLNIEDL